MSQWYVGDFFSVSVGALFFVVLKFRCEISNDLIEHTVFPRISAGRLYELNECALNRGWGGWGFITFSFK